MATMTIEEVKEAVSRCIEAGETFGPDTPVAMDDSGNVTLNNGDVLNIYDYSWGSKIYPNEE